MKLLEAALTCVVIIAKGLQMTIYVSIQSKAPSRTTPALHHVFIRCLRLRASAGFLTSDYCIACDLSPNAKSIIIFCHFLFLTVCEMN